MIGRLADRLFGKDAEQWSLEELTSTKANKLPLDRKQPEETQTATFAMGCFWGPDALFGMVPGVVRTRVGYAGGESENPTYHGLGGHTETVQLDFDPEKVSYKELLELFWEHHAPTRRSMRTQYRAFVFYHDDDQRQAAEASKKELSEELDDEVKTEIREYPGFYPAESYHQKYHLKEHPDIAEALLDVYTKKELVNSTVAARLNGYVSGYGSVEQFEEDVGRFGLPDAPIQEVRRLVQKLQPAEKC